MLERCGLDGGAVSDAGTRPVGRIGGRIAQGVWERDELLSKAQGHDCGRAKELMGTAGRRGGRNAVRGRTHLAKTTAPYGGGAGGLRDRRLTMVNGLAARPSPACFGARRATGGCKNRGAGVPTRFRGRGGSLACRGLSLLLEFSGKRSFDGCAGLGEARGRGNDLGKRRGRLGKQRGRRIHESANDIGRRHRG